jgi:hypothetical protein
MSSLSAPARRFVALALTEQGNDRQQAEWRVWADSPEREMPPHLAQIALHALSGMALRIGDRIADEATNPTEAAQLENDLGYVADIEIVLLEYLHQMVGA